MGLRRPSRRDTPAGLEDASPLGARPYEGAPLVREDGRFCAQTGETAPCPVTTSGWQAFSRHYVVSN